MSCYDVTTCPSEHLFNRIVCNFTIAHMKYICNSTVTCKRLDGFYDCCSSNIAYCTVQKIAFELMPTVLPTIQPNMVNECEKICNLTPSTNKCYWYESQNLDISCINKDNNYCCSDGHSDCCNTHIIYAYIILGSLFFLFTTGIYYTSITHRYTQVTPEKTTSNTPSKLDNTL
jgi:hypothetical protein